MNDDPWKDANDTPRVRVTLGLGAILAINRGLELWYDEYARHADLDGIQFVEGGDVFVVDDDYSTWLTELQARLKKIEEKLERQDAVRIAAQSKPSSP